MPSMRDLAYDISGMEWFSLTDLNDAFLQLELEDESKPITTFTSKDKLYMYNRLNLGLKVASEIFQSVMTQQLAGVPKKKVAIDEILSFGRTYEEAKEAVSKLLSKLQELGLTANKKKSIFMVQELTFYGMVISKEGIKPNKSKMKDFMDTTPPKTIKDLHSFLGVSAYFANRIPYSSIITQPLRMMLK